MAKIISIVEQDKHLSSVEWVVKNLPRLKHLVSMHENAEKPESYEKELIKFLKRING